MQALHEVPFLSRLPRVELAKLVSDILSISVPAGEAIYPQDDQSSYVYFITSGKVGVFLQVGEMPVSLMVLGPGEVIGEGTGTGNTERPLEYRAMEDAVLYRLERSRFEGILAQHPTLLKQFSQAVVNRSYSVLDELARTKSALLVHATEVWSMVEGAEQAVQQVSATVAPAPAPAHVGVEEVSPGVDWKAVRRRFGVHGLPVLGAILVYWFGGPGLDFTPTRAFLSILTWGVGAWLSDVLPDYVVALTITMAATVAGVVQPEVAFSGFSNRTWFLLLAVLGISAGISRTGLLYRVALHMLRLFPATYTGQSVALAIGGLLLAPFLPGVTGRQAMASRLSLELGEAMGFRPNSKGTAGIALACFLGFSCIYYISLTGGSVTLMVWSVLPEAAKAGLSWSGWFLAALPVSLLVFSFTLWAIIRLYRPAEAVRISPTLVNDQLRVLGPMGRDEWTTVWVVLAIVGAFITQPIHGVDPTWVALPGFLLLGAAGIVDKDVLRKGIDWGFLLLTGGLLGIAALTSQSGFVSLFSGILVPLVRPLSGSPWLFLTAVAVATAVVHFAVPFQPTILLCALAFAPVAAEFGYNPFVVGLVILVMASHFVIPHSNPMYMAAFGGSERRAFTHQQARKLSWVHAGITLVAVWASVPLWQLLGLL